MAGRTFRTRCMCGCGDGIEMVEEKGRIKVSFFRDDTGAKASILRERAEYVAGKNLLREIMMDRDTFLEMLDFLESARLEDMDKGGANRSHLAPTHLLDDIYAVWLQGTLPVKAVFGDGFRKMFGLVLTAMDRDVLVVQMKGWLAREKTHAIPEGASPHVDRLAGTSAPVRKAPTKDEVAGMASTAIKSVKAAAKAAMDAARRTADPEGAAMEDELEAESRRALGRGAFGKRAKQAGPEQELEPKDPDDDVIPELPEEGGDGPAEAPAGGAASFMDAAWQAGLVAGGEASGGDDVLPDGDDEASDDDEIPDGGDEVPDGDDDEGR